MTTKYRLDFPNVSGITDKFPSLNDILPSFTNPFILSAPAGVELGFAWPPTNLLPAIPDISTMFGDYKLNIPDIEMPSWCAVQMAAGVLLGQITAVINTLWTKIKQVLQVFLLAIPSLPAWPGFPGFGLPDLMAKSPGALLSHISLPDFDFSTIQDFVEWDNFLSPDMKAFSALQSSAAGFMALVVDTIVGAVHSITAWIASIGGGSFTLNIPTIPTFSEMKDMLPDFPSASDVYALSIPGFSSFSLPSPLIPNFDWPSFEFSYAIGGSIMSMLTENVKKIVNFCKTLPTVGTIFTSGFPTIADLTGVLPDIPSICHETNPDTGPVCT